MRRTDDFLKAPPALTPIPLATTPDELTVRHPGYDIRPAQADPGVAFPLQHLLECSARVSSAKWLTRRIRSWAPAPKRR